MAYTKVSQASAQISTGPQFASELPPEHISHNLAVVAREDQRLAALDRYDILDTPSEEAFSRISRLLKQIFNVPMAAVSFIDGHRQWHKASEGIGVSETPRPQTFCTHTIQENRPLIVADPERHPIFATNPSVTGDPKIRFYAGVPLRTHDGHNIGSLCVVDTKPRDFGPEQIQILSDLSAMVVDELELRRMATTDSLTGALSRRAFKDEARRLTALALRHHHDLSCVMFDLDRFKSINDTFGHAAGDEVLTRTVRASMAQLRETDILGRLGGEEFAVLLPNTAAKGAAGVAEKLRAAIQELEFEFSGRPVKATASFGIASLDASTRDAESLLNNADAALYKAKGEGRNRSVTWSAAPDGMATLRRRVLKGGKILFNGNTSAIDCTVRSLSEDGAGIDVSSTLGVPRSFRLAITADDLEKPCRVLSQTDRHLEVAFC